MPDLNNSLECSHRRREFLIAVFFVLLAAFLVRLPLVSAGLPYLYREDDTHHFNRTVEMVKRGDLNPYYFHKPSLHFYVRMPVVWATIEWMKARGEIQSIKEIRTRDPYGLAGYNFTASHPLVVKTNRALSIAMSLAAVFFSMLIVVRLGGSVSAATIGGLILSFSPEFLINSPIVGVDILMALLTVVSSWLALEIYRSFSRSKLLLLSVVTGLAVSSKYNAAPIVALPFILLLLKRNFSPLFWFYASAAIAFGFFAGSPYILVSLPTFIEQVSYEVWHYRVAGHAGHSAEPGLEQAMFYLNWFVTDGVGYGAAIFATIGAWVICRKRWDEGIVLLAFPLLFAALMIAQKTNFTRNMVPVVPYAAICAALAISNFQFFRSSLVQLTLLLALGAAALGMPFVTSVRLVIADYYAPESRREIVRWIEGGHLSGDVAVAGQLLLPIQTFYRPGIDAFDPRKVAISKLILDGYSHFVVPAELGIDDHSRKIISQSKVFEGITPLSRIVQNPSSVIYSFNPSQFDELKRDESISKLELRVLENDSKDSSCRDGGENYCWLQQRVTELKFGSAGDRQPQTVEMEVMSPWPNQEVKIYSGENVVGRIAAPQPGVWSTLSISLEPTESFSAAQLFAYVSEVHSPKSLGTSEDARRLGVAVRMVRGR